MTPKHLIILGTHGIPAKHGGFETCAEKLALHMRGQEWDVTVYGQAQEASSYEWNGIHCINLKKFKNGFLSYLNPLLLDLKAIWHSRRIKGVFLTLGYNTALFNLLLWFYRRPQMINMDGMEWQRSKYKRWHEKAWLRFNEWCALRLADVAVADHDAISDYLRRQKPDAHIITIANGADNITTKDASINPLADYDLQPFHYGLIIARPEPENQILEMVQAWHEADTNWPLVILGNYNQSNPYQRLVLEFAGEKIKFVGAIYDAFIVKSLRFYAGLYLHGHKVGGTNPSLVEAMAAGCLTIAHDNVYNRGVAKETALYFQDHLSLVKNINQNTNNETNQDLKQQTRNRHATHYTWFPILQHYQSALESLRQKPL